MERQVHEKIKRFVNENQLIKAGDELILGVSGGADSMMMLYYFFSYKEEYQVTLKVAHIHHGLREAAELDAKLVEEQCRKLKIPFFRHNCDIKALAIKEKISEEEAGRQERYNFFISLLSRDGKIVTAHNMNDQAETMLMHFIRGTDIKGLAGIPPRRERIIRPLLCLTREEIEGYCKFNQIPYRHDETNFKPIYSRNKMRLKCIPYIKEAFNENVIAVLGNHSHVYREENEFLEQYTSECFSKCSHIKAGQIILNYEMLNTYHVYIQKRIFMKAIEQLASIRDITLKHLQSCVALMELQMGKEIHLPYNIIVRKDYEGIIFSIKTEQLGYHFPLHTGINTIPELDITLYISELNSKEFSERISQKNENNYTKYIDYGKIKNGLQIRSRKSSDYIRLGQGTKKLKKLFIDDKISKTLRDTMPLIADGDEIVWVVGNRLSTHYYVTNTTNQILEIKILKGHE